VHAVDPLVCSHAPEPKAGSILTGDGRRADLFNFRHYPVRALCRLCGESIRAESFFQPFEHVDGEQLARLIPFPGQARSALAPSRSCRMGVRPLKSLPNRGLPERGSVGLAAAS
jgi:hypothetical protein